MIKFDTTYANIGITESKLKSKYQKKVNQIHEQVVNKTAPGVNMMGWMHPENLDKNEINTMIKKSREWSQAKIKNILVIGIGGSYIGIKAAIDMINIPFIKKPFNITYVANISSSYIAGLLNSLGNEPFAIVIISKSGTTLEPAIAFNVFRSKLIQNVGIKRASELIVAITDKSKGTLYELSKANDYTMLSIPDNIGGRYSTLTAVGMFIFVLNGLDCNQILKGATDAFKHLSSTSLDENTAFLYACYRHYFYTKRKIQVENFIVYDPTLSFVGEQWKQLFGESEGKNHKAMYPTTSLFTTDLHALGQYLQEGTRNFIETTLFVKESNLDLKLQIKSTDDKISYLNNKSLHEINKIAFHSTVQAHNIDGKVNNLIITIDKANEYYYGYLFMWLSMAAMMSSYLLQVNPFDQPGVEAYKLRMFEQLKKE